MGADAATQGTQDLNVDDRPLIDVLEVLCRTMEDESLDGVIACIHPVNEDATVFRDTAAPSLDKSYRKAVDGILVSSMTGPCCLAIITRQTVLVPDIAADPRWSKFRDFAEPLGIKSAWSTPIFSNEGKVLGTFAHYYAEARDPSPRDKRMVELLARAAAVAIERSRAEAALRELNATLAQRVEAETRERLQIWNVSLDLLAIATAAGTVLNINPAWTAILGWSEADLVGKPYEGILHPDDRERARVELGRLADGQKTLQFENRLRAKDGSYRWISWNAAPDGGRIYGMGRDVTEHKRDQDILNRVGAELAHVSRVTDLSALTASVAHEVNQPLTAIITNARTCLRMLDRTPPDIDGARETIRRTLRDGDRASDVITRLRALFGKREFTPELVDLNDAAREVLALLSNDLQRTGIVLRCEFAGDLPLVSGDRVQLQQVVLNLVRNACDAMIDVEARARELLVKTERDEGNLARLTVRDAGVGLSPETLDSLFDPFVTTKSGGMGIGLFVSRSIIERHHGRLWARRNEGAPGATFCFSVPCVGEDGGTR